MGHQSSGVHLRSLPSSTCAVLPLWREDKSKEQVGTNNIILDLIVFVFEIKALHVSIFNCRHMPLEEFQPFT